VPASDQGTQQFIAAIAKHRHFARQSIMGTFLDS
jgi:hypothetical protein